MLATHPASADEPASSNDLVPPRALAAGVVPYPEGAAGAATVLVELVVDRDGKVSDARLVSGTPPFTHATLAAAWGWTFVPARRAGDAIPARVRVQVDFVPPHVIAPPPVSAPQAAPVTEVRVAGTRAPPQAMTLGGGEVRQIPGAFGDTFRAIDALPGVVPMASGLPYFFIRGAPPGDTGTFVDGVRVPLLFHAAVGPSVIHPALVDHAELFAGGAPAEYGRYVGGVLSAEIPPPLARAHGEAIVRVFDAGALAEAPFADGRGTALAAGRYSYSGAVLSLTSPILLQYWDYQARATWKLDDANQLGLFAFGSSDDFGQRVKGVTDTILDGGFHRLDLRWDHKTARGKLRVAATLGYARSNNDYNDIENLTAGVRARYEERVSERTTIHAGGDLTIDHYDLLSNTNPMPDVVAETNLIYPPHTDVAVGTYADLAWKMAPRVEVIPGLRVDLFEATRYDNPSAYLGLGPGSIVARTSTLLGVDPRLTTRVVLAPRVALVSTVAVAQEPATYVVPVPGLTIVEPSPVLQTGVQMSQGLRFQLPWDVTLDVTGFLHEYRHLSDLTATCPSVFGAGVLLGYAPRVMNSACVVETVNGQAFGGELLLKRALTKRLGGWVAYTLSRSTRDAPSPTGQGMATLVSSFDRPNVLSVVLSYDLGRGWNAGARFVTYSGLPYSSTRYYVPVAPFNGERMPAFYRLDVRLEKRWHIGERATLSFVIEGMNVTLTKEVLGEHCAPTGFLGEHGLDTCTPQTLGPVTVPSIGIEGRM